MIEVSVPIGALPDSGALPEGGATPDGSADVMFAGIVGCPCVVVPTRLEVSDKVVDCWPVAGKDWELLGGPVGAGSTEPTGRFGDVASVGGDPMSEVKADSVNVVDTVTAKVVIEVAGPGCKVPGVESVPLVGKVGEAELVEDSSMVLSAVLAAMVRLVWIAGGTGSAGVATLVVGPMPSLGGSAAGAS